MIKGANMDSKILDENCVLFNKELAQYYNQRFQVNCEMSFKETFFRFLFYMTSRLSNRCSKCFLNFSTPVINRTRKNPYTDTPENLRSTLMSPCQKKGNGRRRLGLLLESEKSIKGMTRCVFFFFFSFISYFDFESLFIKF